jgi:hypothetical protein
MDRLLLRVMQAASLLILIGFFAIKSACACSSKESAYRAAIKSDLRNLVTAQGWYYRGHQSYAQSIDDLDYEASNGVTVSVRAASDRMLVATGTHSDTSWKCDILVTVTQGESPPDVEGPHCWR